ncbi:MAG: hypothetical protein H8E83_07280 [Planctomycetes bacterium]|nr:hypothetical protein [Planctomycetota bacterium]
MSEKNNNLSSKCVVLVPLERIDAAKDIAQKYELNAIFEHHPTLAMAEICLLQKAMSNSKAWSEDSPSPHLLLVHISKMQDTEVMVDAIRKYLPNVRISELRNGRLEPFENHGAVVDMLEDPPIIHSEAIDADELSMLLDPSHQEVKEE